VGVEEVAERPGDVERVDRQPELVLRQLPDRRVVGLVDDDRRDALEAGRSGGRGPRWP
jgi:hypothetical protein